MSQFPNDENGAILQCLAEHQFNFHVEHPVDFFALLYTEGEAQQVADIYQQRQKDDETITDVEQRTADDGKSFELVVTQMMMVTYDNVRRAEKQLADVCREYKGTTDGWGVLHDDGEEE